MQSKFGGGRGGRGLQVRGRGVRVCVRLVYIAQQSRLLARRPAWRPLAKQRHPPYVGAGGWLPGEKRGKGVERISDSARMLGWPLSGVTLQ